MTGPARLTNAGPVRLTNVGSVHLSQDDIDAALTVLRRQRANLIRAFGAGVSAHYKGVAAENNV